MARVYTYAVIAVALMIFLPYVGMPTAFDSIAMIFGLDNGNLSFSDFFLSLFGSTAGILATIGLAGITIGLLLSGKLENFIMIPLIVGPLAAMIGVFYSIWAFGGNIADLWIRVPLLTIMGAFIIGYIISLAEWFRGNI